MLIILEQNGKIVSLHASNISHINFAKFSLIYRQVVMLLQYSQHISLSETKIYIVDYPSSDHEFISVQKDDLKTKEWTLFNLRSNIYLAYFYQNIVTFYHLDIKPNKSLALIPLQELKHPTISGFDVHNLDQEEALPFYS